MYKMLPFISKNRILREILGLVTLVATVFITFSLISFDPADPSFNHYIPYVTKVNNLWGVAGSYLSDCLLQFSGLASYLFSIILFITSVRLFITKEFKFNYYKLISYFFLILSTAGLLSMSFSHVRLLDEVIVGGGILGGLLVSEVESCFNRMGAYTLLILVFISSLIICTDLSLSWFSKKIKDLFLSIITLLKRFYSMRRGRVKCIAKKPCIKKEKKKFKGSDMPTIIDSSEKDDAIKGVETLKHVEFDIPRPKGFYQLPPLSLLESQAPKVTQIDRESLIMNSKIVEKKLLDFGVEGKVTEVRPGPVITMYEYEPAPGVKINRIVNLSNDLALALKAISVRIVAPIPGKSVVGIEIPNTVRETVFFKDIVSQEIYQKAASRLTVVLGKDIFGNPVVTDLAKMPHLLIAGSTGTGKSVSVNSMISSILFKADPEEVRMIMIDPKRLELSLYDGIPHLLSPVVTEPKQAATVLKWLVEEMENRYKLLAEKGVRNILQYNQKLESEASNPNRISEDLDRGSSSGEGSESEDHHEKLPLIAVIIDELADLMMVSSKEVEGSIARLAQMARAAGIHLIVATQRPSVDVLTGIIKVNFPARISFQVSSKIDSRTILDASGAEHLLGSGDMLVLQPGTSKLERIHGAYLSEREIRRLVAFIKQEEPPAYDKSILEPKEDVYSKSDDAYDEKYDEAVELVAKTKQASISMVQRHLRIGYNRAARIIEKMEEEGVVGPSDGVKPREVLINKL